ncbi:hypothetical protein LMH87_009616 [Akanthomyces muscarius]|uniref:Uncharacterized protein n=1 Tax=Akanthomyces muscarius TaxID=2231603 RepID=A0A9W8QEA2_AKAMU|nr:hypothetical protein LMH87_009616 [Akanthomyces muscarius]KAJ4153111.1 hypothetical protein LMH87_009616 [Akanthomyces muscarius]
MSDPIRSNSHRYCPCKLHLPRSQLSRSRCVAGRGRSDIVRPRPVGRCVLCWHFPTVGQYLPILGWVSTAPSCRRQNKLAAKTRLTRCASKRLPGRFLFF